MEVASAPGLKMKEIGKEIAKEVEENVRRSFEKLQEDLVKIINEAFSPIQRKLKLLREELEEEDNQKNSERDEEVVTNLEKVRSSGCHRKVFGDERDGDPVTTTCGRNFWEGAGYKASRRRGDFSGGYTGGSGGAINKSGCVAAGSTLSALGYGSGRGYNRGGFGGSSRRRLFEKEREESFEPSGNGGSGSGGGPLGGYFERGGAGGSGSGGVPGVVFGGSPGSKSGSGCLQVLGDICDSGCMLDGGKKCFTGGSGCGLSYLAGNWKFGVGTATCGGLKGEGGVVLKCRCGSNGSSGGPGTFSDEKSTGDSDLLAGKNVGDEDGRHSWRGLLQKIPELEQQRRMSEVWVGLEKKPWLEGGSNGNLVITEKRESMGQPISKFSQPNLPVSNINPTAHRPTFLTPKIFSPYFIKLIQHLIVTLNSFSDFHTISSTLTLTSQPHGLPLPCDHLITTPTFFISPVPNFLSSSTASLTSPLHLFKPKTFKPQAHNTSSTPYHFRHSFLHHFQDFFFLVEALTRARELYEEEQQHELKHKLGLGTEGLQDTEYTSRGPEFSDDYDPP